MGTIRPACGLGVVERLDDDPVVQRLQHDVRVVLFSSTIEV
jgi:hypothetical protein